MAKWSRALTLNYRSLIPVYVSLSGVISEKAAICLQNAKEIPANVNVFCLSSSSAGLKPVVYAL